MVLEVRPCKEAAKPPTLPGPTRGLAPIALSTCTEPGRSTWGLLRAADLSQGRRAKAAPQK